ncbi:2-keto-3-deoxygluconate permease [Helcococcus bovis]|uniref:2-keto-3-deoxygluconate permease n=1 Tax=Helcococcus bovis TaxID=3153252 RepID=A0ABW9F5I7_9FIRM
MINIMKKVPAGTVLIPMFISALFTTFAPGLFNIGGVTQAVFTGESLNFIVGMACFASGLILDFKTLLKVFKKQGILLLAKAIICIVLGFIFIKIFGHDGIVGISAVAFITAICACNPAIYLSIMQDVGEEEDVAAFGLIGLMAVPVLPMFIYSISASSGAVNLMPIISTLIPIILGMLLGNFDKSVKETFAPLFTITMPYLGWQLGASINLKQAFQSAGGGLLIVVLYYAIMLPSLMSIEKKFVNSNGLSSIAMSSIPGLSIGIPAMIAVQNMSDSNFVADAASQLTFAVIFTSIVTPLLAKQLASGNLNKIVNKSKRRQRRINKEEMSNRNEL